MAGGRQGTHGTEELPHLLRGEYRRRLVQNENPRLAVENLDDLNALLLAYRQIAYQRARVHRQAIAISDGPDLFGHGIRSQPPTPKGALLTQHYVFGNRHYRDKHEVLVHHAYTTGNSIGRAVESDPPSLNVQRTRVGSG
ncbi:MAG: hypothetical protein BWY79_02043 [Actinobacteria bacterium ADurb.Bin444]|nr:MAG: hypothetical protein BWY79_02043 [Actinobacteria bacterium ADurb.Bin444]